MRNTIGFSFTSMQCGGGYYDLSSLSTRDMYYNGVGQDYWVRLCAFVTAPNCTAVQPTSVCQPIQLFTPLHQLV
jgi:hypothetical protein